MKQPRNIVGPQVRALREKRGLTQPMLAAKCHLLGWDSSRESLAKIEAQIRWVADAELLCLAKSLRVPVESLLPSTDQGVRVMKQFFRSSTTS
jgi:transcriptional regulator with XRE-family HTH domain